MIIDKKIKNYIIYSEDSLKEALVKIENNHSKTIFVVSADNKLLGVLTDGDFRRWLLDDSIPNHSLDQPISVAMNTNFQFLYTDENPHRIIESLNEKITIIPLINDKGILISIARNRTGKIQIGKFTIQKDSPSFIIAEIGNNHNGDIQLAKRLVDLAKDAGADCVKFQMRSLKQLYKNSGNANDFSEDLGSQYTLDLLNKFQLKDEELFRVFDYCYSKDILPLCTPWDEDSFFALEKYGLEAYKVASADFTNHSFLKLLSSSGKPLICSTGMTSENEILQSIRVLQENGAQYILLHCNSTYPAPFKDINLNYIEHLQKIGDCPVGYSGHERGISVAIAAIAKGSKVIEKHFTIDQSMEGNDHKVSLLPNELKELVKSIREVEESLGSANDRKITQGELMNRETLGKSLVLNCDLKKGSILSSEMIDIRSPGKGLPPYYMEKLVGKVLKRDMSQGDFFYKTDIDEEKLEIKTKFQFQRPWGLPVRYHDLDKMISLTNLNLVEFHFSYKDLEIHIEEFLTQKYSIDFLIHSPELFQNDHLLNLCTDDEVYRKKSVSELQKVIDITNKLKEYFPNSNPRPLIIINVGGFSLNHSLSVTMKERLMGKLELSLGELDRRGVELIPQTMPPFPWLFGGQRYHNLFLDPDEIVDFCKRNRMRICLDVSHSKLACNFYHWSFQEFIEKVSPYIAHMHLVDAKGVDGEGLQIGEGEIDFYMLAKVLSKKSPSSSFIPEIWQGHKNNGEAFFYALNKLEKFKLYYPDF